MKRTSKTERDLYEALRTHPVIVRIQRPPDILEKLDALKGLSEVLHTITGAHYEKGGRKCQE